METCSANLRIRSTKLVVSGPPTSKQRPALSATSSTPARYSIRSLSAMGWNLERIQRGYQHQGLVISESVGDLEHHRARANGGPYPQFRHGDRALGEPLAT